MSDKEDEDLKIRASFRALIAERCPAVLEPVDGTKHESEIIKRLRLMHDLGRPLTGDRVTKGGKHGTR